MLLRSNHIAVTGSGDRHHSRNHRSWPHRCGPRSCRVNNNRLGFRRRRSGLWPDHAGFGVRDFDLRISLLLLVAMKHGQLLNGNHTEEMAWSGIGRINQAHLHRLARSRNQVEISQGQALP